MSDMIKELRLGTKSDVLTYFAHIEVHSHAPSITWVVINERAIIKMWTPETYKIFDEYALLGLVSHIISHFDQATRINLVWAAYNSHT